MKKTSVGLLAAVVLAGCQSVPESGQIRYVAVTRVDNARAIVAILKCLEQPGCEALLGEGLQCGPFLWRQLKDHPALAKVGTRTQFTVPQSDASGGPHDVTLEGARFDGATQTSPMETVASLSNWCSKVTPLLTVLMSPPEAVAIQ